MNAVDDKAIGIGVAIGIAFVVATIALSPLIFASGLPIWLIIGVQHAFGVTGKFAAGFAAGWIARRDGALHGAFVGAVTGVLGFALGMGLAVVRGGGAVFSRMSIETWISIVAWMAVGVGVAALAGLIAERVRR
jgi:hypothetical protein